MTFRTPTIKMLCDVEFFDSPLRQFSYTDWYVENVCLPSISQLCEKNCGRNFRLFCLAIASYMARLKWSRTGRTQGILAGLYFLYKRVKNWYAWLEKTSCFSASAEVQYPKPEYEKEPFWTGYGSYAASGQEGLFDHMFDHRQRRSTRKQWN